MKIRFALLTVIAIFAMSFSCDDDALDKLLEIDGPIDFSRTYTVDIQDGDPTEFTKIEEFETSYNGIDITDVEINSMTLGIRNFESEELVLMDMTFYFEGLENERINIIDYDLSAHNNQSYDLKDLADARIAEFEEFLLNNENAKMIIEMTVDNTPVYFDFDFDMSVTVTGTPTGN
ncbi:hypothetical protein [Marivirga atlantica]|uniref:Uncharacterized protein n=1 Tax=Marivirga atlantica TaxID=1548457 RepID=A0A937AEV6_9BACT|nr:hypothetical protein [Marivirga atlantica]MBL0765209.1 hypothetical protein [Marivirga atlantica]